MKRIAIIGLIMALWGVVPCMAQSSASYENWLVEGNAAYNEGNYEQAMTLYSQVEESGMESAILYFNMGNTYYKMKSFPMAILYYEKALKLDPGNEDIRVNLEIANMAVVDKINILPQSFLVRWWNGLKSSFSADGWAWVSVAVFGVLLLCLFLFLMSRRTGVRKAGFFVGLLMVVCLVLSVLFAVDQYHDLKYQDEAIVMSPTVTVKSSPSENGVNLFVLHEGAKVRIIDSMKDWNKIKIADGSLGYLPASDMVAF
jgi:tetratricopeptide (TPR) repeat protein